jgi:hypothetical protein
VVRGDLRFGQLGQFKDIRAASGRHQHSAHSSVSPSRRFGVADSGFQTTTVLLARSRVPSRPL